jgi:hypothetical protein
MQGEYVDFNLVDVSDKKHEYQANDISGVKNGPIMCESKSQSHRNERGKTDHRDSDTGFVCVQSKRNRIK